MTNLVFKDGAEKLESGRTASFWSPLDDAAREEGRGAEAGARLGVGVGVEVGGGYLCISLALPNPAYCHSFLYPQFTSSPCMLKPSKAIRHWPGT